MNRGALTMAVAVGTLTVLTAGCSGSGDEPAADAFREAIGVLPSSLGALYVVDVERAEKRLGVGDVSGELSDSEAEEYARAFGEGDAIGSSMAPFIHVTKDVGWNASSLKWEAQTVDNDVPATVRRFDDAVDLDELASDLETFGYRPDDHDDTSVLTVGLGDADGAGMLRDGDRELPLRLFGMTVIVLPEQKLVISAPDDAVDQFTGGHETLADVGTFDDLLDVGDSEFVFGQTADAPCGPAGILGESSSDEQAEAIAEPYADLATPEAATVALSEDGASVHAQLRFADADAAGRDAQARETLLTEGTSPVNAEPYAELFDTDEVSADDELGTVELTLKPPATTLLTMIQQRDTPFTACGDA